MDATGPLLGRLDSMWTLGLHTRIGDGRALTRAVAGCSDCSLLEETTFGFYIKDEAQMNVVAGSNSLLWMSEGKMQTKSLQRGIVRRPFRSPLNLAWPL